ncbi:MAG: uL23 family ribosomal protein [Spirochaetia bacterium]
MEKSRLEQVIIRPVLTEKTSFLLEGAKKVYTFSVSRFSNKVEVMKAIEAMFSVKPASCSIVNVRRKKRANVPYRGSVKRGHGFTSSWKKAYVTLPAGVSIPELES